MLRHALRSRELEAASSTSVHPLVRGRTADEPRATLHRDGAYRLEHRHYSRPSGSMAAAMDETAPCQILRKRARSLAQVPSQLLAGHDCEGASDHQECAEEEPKGRLGNPPRWQTRMQRHQRTRIRIGSRWTIPAQNCFKASDCHPPPRSCLSKATSDTQQPAANRLQPSRLTQEEPNHSFKHASDPATVIADMMPTNANMSPFFNPPQYVAGLAG